MYICNICCPSAKGGKRSAEGGIEAENGTARGGVDAVGGGASGVLSRAATQRVAR